MTPATCHAPGCATPRPQSAYLCRACVARLRTRLRDVPALYGELRRTYARLDAIGPPGVRAHRADPLPWKPHAREALDVLTDVLTTWARETLTAGNHPQPLNGGLPAWLAAHAHELAAHPDAGQAYDEITDAVTLAWRTIDTPPDLLLAGVCGAHHGTCRRVLYARPANTTVTCTACHTRHDVTRRRAAMIDAARDTLVSRVVALGWIRVLLDHTISDGTWRSWRSRGRVAPRGADMGGRDLYRFGDVYDAVSGTRGANVA